MLHRIGDLIGHIADRPSRTVMFSAIVTVVFGSFDYFVDASMLELQIQAEIHAATQATFVGLGAGLIALVLLVARRERRKRIVEELTRVAELNHRLRNSLQIIADAHYLEKDEEHKQMMFETVEAMGMALKQLFPTVGVERRARKAG